LVSEHSEVADEVVAGLVADSLSSVRSVRGSGATAAWHELDGILRFRAIARQLSGVDEGTPVVLAAAARGLPEAAIHNAFESLGARRRRQPPLESEVRYMVKALATIRNERTYA
jgi:hypothetical protein